MTAIQKPESILFSSGNVTITNARFLVDNQTYAIRNITSVDKRIKKAPKLTYWLVGVILMLIGLVGYGPSLLIAFGIISIIIGFVVNHKYYVFLKTSAAEMQALESKDPYYIDEVIDALNQAILYH
ncbi:hypothetical protein F971_03210 [Acinetobacter vivianii]|uniref:QacE n=1 Tax=Acinetobacter vivianii TaxID=1776742 RepID=N8UV17_9GAMM|nr:DUF6232 family protein [Acinetobacter vivianii]ENU91245.1 hypothetical protein F971_03210 [Acinetobacter vivianii]